MRPRTVAPPRTTLRGFTVVELIVVIVVIGILAGLAYVTYSGVVREARNTERLNQMKTWENAFKLYASTSKDFKYPAVSAEGGYCLGDKFPTAQMINDKGILASPLPTPGNPLGYCRDLGSQGADSWKRYEANAALNEKLYGIIGKSPSSTDFVKKQFNLWPWAIGPYVEYRTLGTTKTVKIFQLFEGGTCPEGSNDNPTPYIYTEANVAQCSITLPTKYSYDVIP